MTEYLQLIPKLFDYFFAFKVHTVAKMSVAGKMEDML
jgi:hypothetical protein